MRGYRRYYTYLKIPDLAGTVGIEIPKYRGMRGYRRYDNLKIPDLAGTVRYDISQTPVPGTYLTLYTDFKSVISGSTDRRFEIRVQPVDVPSSAPHTDHSRCRPRSSTPTHHE